MSLVVIHTTEDDNDEQLKTSRRQTMTNERARRTSPPTADELVSASLRSGAEIEDTTRAVDDNEEKHVQAVDGTIAQTSHTAVYSCLSNTTAVSDPPLLS